MIRSFCLGGKVGKFFAFLMFKLNIGRFEMKGLEMIFREHMRTLTGKNNSACKAYSHCDAHAVGWCSVTSGGGDVKTRKEWLKCN